MDAREARIEVESIMQKLEASFEERKPVNTTASRKLVRRAELILADFSREEYPELVEADQMINEMYAFFNFLEGLELPHLVELN